MDGRELVVDAGVAREPGDIREAADPFDLPAGELACADLDLLDRVVEGGFALEMIDQFAIARGFACGFGELAEALEERAGFVEPPGFDHLLHARVDPAVE